MPILLRTQDCSFRDLLETRYAGFIAAPERAQFEFDVDLVAQSRAADSDEDARAEMQDGQWLLRRGDFFARWDPRQGRGTVRQSANPYSIDSVLRIVHTLMLARDGGFLLHAASAIRDGHAFLFCGVSGAGKTTISRLAPADAILLTDEISYIRREGDHYRAYGTPFAGELARPGENCSAPIGSLFLLEKGLSNAIEPLTTAAATGRLLRNILFFAEDPELVRMVFRSACDFVERVSVQQLTFVPDERVWELIR